jgi:ubiquitin-protein ligase
MKKSEKMADPHVIKVAIAHFQKSIREFNPCISFAMKEPLEWYILIHDVTGNKNEYTGGEYLATMKVPNEFPHKPPRFTVHTPNGVYDVEKRICISIGEFHENSYVPALGMAGFAQELVNGLINFEGLKNGIGILETTLGEKLQLAQHSKEFNNRYHADKLKLIQETQFVYRQKWPLASVPLSYRQKWALDTFKNPVGVLKKLSVDMRLLIMSYVCYGECPKSLFDKEKTMRVVTKVVKKTVVKKVVKK